MERSWVTREMGDSRNAAAGVSAVSAREKSMKYCSLSQGSISEGGEYEGSLMIRREKKQPGFMSRFVGD